MAKIGNDADKNVAKRIRERRIILGWTQAQLAERVGLTYQQIYKYEAGINRVSAGRLMVIAKATSTPIAYFYEGNEELIHEDGPTGRAVLELARNFSGIRDHKQRHALLMMSRALTAEG